MKEQLQKLYEVDRLTTRQIAPIVGLSPRTVTRKLHEYSIPLRKPGPARHEILRDAAWLTNAYVTEQKSTTQIADEVGATTRVVLTWIVHHGIETRRVGVHTPYIRTEWHKQQTSLRSSRFIGTNNPNYKGGPNRENRALRSSYQSKVWAKSVKDRDAHECQECGISGVILHAHHVLSWKNRPDMRFDVSNGVTVCVICHEKRHGRRFAGWVHETGKIATSANPLTTG